VILTFKVSQMADLGYFVSQMADFEGQDHKNHKIAYNLAHLLKFFSCTQHGVIPVRQLSLYTFYTVSQKNKTPNSWP